MSKYAHNNIKSVFLSLLSVQMFSYITSSLSGIVNGIIIGRYLSNIDMIALGFVSPIAQIVTMFSTIISVGARIVCGNYIGRGDIKKINYTFTVSILSLTVFGLLVTFVGLTSSVTIAKAIASADAIENTALYIRGLCIGMIPTVLIPCLLVFLQMRNQNTYALLSTLLLAVVNMSLSLLAMKYIHIDIFGVGLVTSISQYITLLFIVIRFFMVKSLPRLQLSKDRILKNVLLYGLPSAVSGTLYGLRNSILIKLAANVYGQAATNAVSILNTSCGPFDAINIGVGATALMLASIYIGEKDYDSLISLSKIACKIGMILALSKVGLIYMFADKMALLFGATSGLAKQLTIDLYVAYSLCMPFNILTSVLMNTYQSFGKITYCNILLVLTAFVMPLSFAYLGTSIIGVNSIWYCYVFSEIAILLVLYIVACIKKNKVIMNIDGLLILDNINDKGKHINISIKTIDEVVDVSKKVQNYCISENIDKQKSYISGLCLEEIATNIIEHGFSKSKKKNNEIDIYVDTDNGEVNIRIKDNAVPFDPHIKITDDDPATNIGIKMVSKLAKEMKYQNDFGINVLSIRI